MPRKKPTTESEDVLQLRCMWETVSVYQFVGLFRSKFQFSQFDLEDFEYSLTQEESILVADIFARLLRFSLRRTDIQIFNWEGHIHQFIKEKSSRSKGYLSSVPYRALSPSDRLLLLKRLIDTVYACNSEELTDHLDDHYSPDDMRFLSVGQDALSNQYWYFNGLRLYKDQVSPKKGKAAWQCICNGIEEWLAFLKSICKSTHPDEITLYHYLHDEVMPIIQGALEDKKLEAKQKRKRLKQAAKEAREAEVLREYSLPKIDYQEILHRERQDISKMSDELTKLAQLANSADLQVNTQTLHSPSLPTIKEEGSVRKRLDDNGIKGDNSDLASKMGMNVKADKGATRTKMGKDNEEDDSVFLPEHNLGNGPDGNKDDKVPPRGKRKSDTKLKELDWCGNDGDRDNMKIPKSNGENNKIADGVGHGGMPVPMMGYQQHPQHFPVTNAQEVCVFSTRLANQAAHAIYTGQAESILSFHRSMSSNRDFLLPEQDMDLMRPQDGMPVPNQQLPMNFNHPNMGQPHPMMMDHNPTNQMKGMSLNPPPHPAASAPHMQPQQQMLDAVKTEQTKTGGGRKRPDRPNSTTAESSNAAKNHTTSNKNVSGEGTVGKQSEPSSGTTTSSVTKSKSKSSKRKRPPSSSQPLQPNISQGPSLAGMPPGPNFEPFPQQQFSPNQFPTHQQQMPGMPNMGMRPPIPSGPPQSGPSFKVEATETENLDPSALWENPPSNKKTQQKNANLAWQQEQQMRMMQQQVPGPHLPIMQHQQSPMMSPCHEPMMPNRSFPEGGQSHDPSDMGPFSPASGGVPQFTPSTYKPPQQIDNPTPEQLRHREESLRTLKEMQRLLFPEEHQNRSPTPGRLISPSGGMGSPQGAMMAPQPGMMRPSGPGMMGPQPRPMMHLTNMGPHPNMDNPDAAMGPDQRMAQEQMIMPPPPDWDNMTQPQREWYKLQHEFYSHKRRKLVTDQMKMGHCPGPMPEMHGPGFRDPMDMGPFHPGMPGGPGIGPGPGMGPGMPHGMPGEHGMPPGAAMGRCLPPEMDMTNQGASGPGMTGSGMPGMPGQGMPMPDMPSQTGQGMPPPPPYHGTHNAAQPNMPRRASLSGPVQQSLNQSAPPLPMSPHQIQSGQPSPRANRTNSLPVSGSLPQVSSSTTTSTPTGQITAGNDMKNTSISSSSMQSGQGSSVNVTSGGMSSGSGPTGTTSATAVTTAPITAGSLLPSTQAGPMSRQSMSPPQDSPYRPGHQPPTPTNVSTPNTPGDSTVGSKSRTTGSSIEQSPRPPQPGTPVGDTTSQTVRINQSGGSQPGTPNSVPANGSRQGVATPSSVTPPIAKPGPETATTKSSDGQLAQSSSNQKPVDSVAAGVTTTSAPQQRLVNFPPSQLNRDKAPNFPPRGEDPQQYASTFYQKASKESAKPRYYGAGSPMASEMMGASGETVTAQSGMMRSQQEMTNAQPGVMGPQQRMLTPQTSVNSQPDLMTSQAGVMPSQQRMLAPQAGMMTSQPGMMTSQAGMMTSQAGIISSQQGMASQPRMKNPQEIMTSQPRMTNPQEMMTSQSRMTNPQEMMTSQPRMTNPQEMMTSQPRMTNPQEMMTSQQRMTNPQEMMTSQPRMTTPQEMMTSQPRMTNPQEMMTSQPRMTNPQEMMTSQARMTNPQEMMTSQPRMTAPPPEMTSQPKMTAPQEAMTSHPRMTAQQEMMTSQPRMTAPQEMTPHPRMMPPHSGPTVGDKGMPQQGIMQESGMMRSHSDVMSHPGNMTPQQDMMTSQHGGMMSPQTDMMGPHDSMPPQAGLMQPRMPTSQQIMAQQASPMTSRQGMMSQARMAPPGGLMGSHGNPGMPPDDMMLPHGNMTSQAGMMMSQGNMATSQTGMMPQQRMMSPQATMMQQQGMSPQTRMSSHSPVMEPPPMGMEPHPMDGPMGFYPMLGNMPNNAGMQDMRGMHNMPNRYPGPKQMHRNLPMSSSIGPNAGPVGRTSMPGGGSPMMHMDGNLREPMMPMESKAISQSQAGRTVHTSSPSPLSLLQSRFSPPLLPDGKGPKQTLQYFPQGNPTPAPQAQSGNPHLNPSNTSGTQGPGPSPKQIQMPFPLEMVTGNPPSMTPSFGPSQRMPGPSNRMCGPDAMYPQGYPASNRPRHQIPGYMGGPRPPMQYGGPSMGMPNTMGQQMPGNYGPGFGPPQMPGNNMGMGDSMMPGYNMPK